METDKSISTRQPPARSMLHGADLTDVERPTAAKNGDQNRQADGSFGGGDHDHEKCRGMADHVLLLAREGEERQVGGVQHQLDAHEHHQGIAANQNAKHPHAEQDRRENQVMVGGYHERFFQIRDLATTTAPTIATSSKRETTSNGRTYCE